MANVVNSASICLNSNYGKNESDRRKEFRIQIQPKIEGRLRDTDKNGFHTRNQR